MRSHLPGRGGRRACPGCAHITFAGPCFVRTPVWFWMEGAAALLGCTDGSTFRDFDASLAIRCCSCGFATMHFAPPRTEPSERAVAMRSPALFGRFYSAYVLLVLY